MKLVLPSPEYAGEIAAYRREFLQQGGSMDGAGPLRRMEDPLEWIAFCQRLMRGEAEDWVADTQFLYVREADGKIVGMMDVRHDLNDYLAEYGGHIGYSVRPGERRKGYAGRMLALGLDYCWDQLGLDRVMVNCLEENEASRRTILKNGGVYERTVVEKRGERSRTIQRYWIARPRTMLVTGFAPAGGQNVTPSWEAVQARPDTIGPWRIKKLLLPVTFGRAAREAIQKAREIRAGAVLSVGQAGGRKAVTPERIGINLRDARLPDQEDQTPRDEPVVPEGPAAYFATLPVKRMAEAVATEGIPCQVSCSAGTYVCNDVLYSLLHAFNGTAVRCGFVHVPYMDGQGEPSLPLSDIVRALEAIIREIGETGSDPQSRQQTDG